MRDFCIYCTRLEIYNNEVSDIITGGGVGSDDISFNKYIEHIKIRHLAFILSSARIVGVKWTFGIVFLVVYK